MGFALIAGYLIVAWLGVPWPALAAFGIVAIVTADALSYNRWNSTSAATGHQIQGLAIAAVLVYIIGLAINIYDTYDASLAQRVIVLLAGGGYILVFQTVRMWYRRSQSKTTPGLLAIVTALVPAGYLLSFLRNLVNQIFTESAGFQSAQASLTDLNAWIIIGPGIPRIVAIVVAMIGCSLYFIWLSREVPAVMSLVPLWIVIALTLSVSVGISAAARSGAEIAQGNLSSVPGAASCVEFLELPQELADIETDPDTRFVMLGEKLFIHRGTGTTLFIDPPPLRFVSPTNGQC